MISPPKTWDTPTSHLTEAITNDWYKTIQSILSEIFYTTTAFYRKREMDAALLPITCGSVSSPMGLGSDSEPVCVDLFGEKTYLADSMQFQLEYILRNSDAPGVFYVMPTFRGETPDNNHLNQFFHSEAEIKGGLAQVMQLVNEYVSSLTEGILNSYGDILPETKHLINLLAYDTKFPQVKFSDAIVELKEVNGALEEIIPGHFSITRAGEKHLIQEYGGVVWLTHMDKLTVPFYQKSSISNDYAECADLLFGMGEIVGCGQRHTSYPDLIQTMQTHRISSEDYDWYLKMKEIFPLETSGFGMGIERFVMWLLQTNDIRDISILPRIKGHKFGP